MKTPKRTSAKVVAPKGGADGWPPSCLICHHHAIKGHVDICRRYPPAPVMTAGGLVACFPPVKVDEPCGEFRPI